jgi:hypothetical protein
MHSSIFGHAQLTQALRSSALVAQSNAATANSRHLLASVFASVATSALALLRSMATGIEI